MTNDTLPLDAPLGEFDGPFRRLVAAMVGPTHEAGEADERSYREFIEALGVAVYTTDAAGHITFFNEAAVSLWGRRPELGEVWCGSWRLFWPDGTAMEHGDCPMAIALRENRAVRGLTAMAQRPDGTFVDFEPYPTPLRDAEGRLVGAVNVMVDITERRRATDELRSVVDALAASNAVKDEFLGLVSHELRTPLTTIYGNAQLLRDGAARRSPDERTDMAADIAEDADRLLAIVENLLLLSRLQAGARPDLEPQVLIQVVREEVASFSRRHPDARIRVAHVPHRDAIVDADRAYLTVLIQNLLANAYKYGGTSEDIEVGIGVDETDASITVLDRGIGLDDIGSADLFQPFYRSPAAQLKAGGIGLGLSVCQRIAEMLGGRIWAVPRDGGGSEFGFTIPLTAPSGPSD
jgi:PAS domain S-box-containing protein